MILAIAVVLYASAVNEIVVPMSESGNPLVFQFQYGWSFTLAGISFIMSMISAVINSTVYARQMQEKACMPCVTHRAEHDTTIGIPY